MQEPARAPLVIYWKETAAEWNGEGGGKAEGVAGECGQWRLLPLNIQNAKPPSHSEK